MRRSFILLLVVGLAGASLIGGSYLLARQLCVRHLASPGDDLEWLRREFKLSDAEYARVRTLHEGYLPQCREMCARIAAGKQELETALIASTNAITPGVEQKLAEVAALRARCQTGMLRHFQEVSQVMPPEQGRRYLAEMQRLTLGFHDQFERGMSPANAPVPQHEHH